MDITKTERWDQGEQFILPGGRVRTCPTVRRWPSCDAPRYPPQTRKAETCIVMPHSPLGKRFNFTSEWSCRISNNRSKRWVVYGLHENES
jgi:hypothetical protein